MKPSIISNKSFVKLPSNDSNASSTGQQAMLF